MRRAIVEIDRDKCNGCGQCVTSCAEGALKIIDGKAMLASETYCDGLGACLNRCPQDAIRVVEREAPAFDQAAAAAHQPAAAGHSCPGSRAALRVPAALPAAGPPQESQLGHWPIQLHLVPVTAPFFSGADLLIAASCVPFAYAGFHPVLLPGKSLIIACPKLDRTEPYLEKLTAIFTQNDIRSVTVAVMEVPCCQGLIKLARQALHDSGEKMAITVEVIGVNGERK